MAQLMRVGKVHTTQGIDDEGYRYVQYHTTKVVRWNNDEIILFTNGWLTQTTRTRMNQTSNQFGLGFRVYQKDFNWWIEYRGTPDITFFDGIILNRNHRG